MNVARASLEELLLDYEDFLRQRHFEMWELNSPEALAVRNVPKEFKRKDQTNLTDLTDQQRAAETRGPFSKGEKLPKKQRVTYKAQRAQRVNPVLASRPLRGKISALV